MEAHNTANKMRIERTVEQLGNTNDCNCVRDVHHASKRLMMEVNRDRTLTTKDEKANKVKEMINEALPENLSETAKSQVDDLLSKIVRPERFRGTSTPQ